MNPVIRTFETLHYETSWKLPHNCNAINWLSCLSLKRFASMNNIGVHLKHTFLCTLVIVFTIKSGKLLRIHSDVFFFRISQNARLFVVVTKRRSLHCDPDRNINVRVPITCVSLKRNVPASYSTLLCQIHIRDCKSILRKSE